MNTIVITEEKCNELSNIASYLLTNVKTKNPFDIANALGISIAFIPTNNTFGFVDKGKTLRDATIYIPCSVSNYSKKLICAHEMGHLFSDDSALNFFDSKDDPVKEFYANYFASCLMPNAFITAPLSNFDTIEEFNEYVTNMIY